MEDHADSICVPAGLRSEPQAILVTCPSTRRLRASAGPGRSNACSIAILNAAPHPCPPRGPPDRADLAVAAGCGEKSGLGHRPARGDVIARGPVGRSAPNSSVVPFTVTRASGAPRQRQRRSRRARPSLVSVGKSSRMLSMLSPSARLARTVRMVTRVPRMTGSPPQVLESRTILA